MKDVFISYSTQDQATKDELVQLFDSQQITYFLDANDLPLGEDIEEHLKKHLKETLFTVMLVSKNSLFSTWVGMEAIHRLKQEDFGQTTSFLPILIDKDILDIRFPITMAKVFKAKQTELETLRDELRELGQRTEIYDVEINRISRIDVSDILSKIRNSLSADFTNEARKPKDVEKLIQTILSKKTPNSSNQTNVNTVAEKSTNANVIDANNLKELVAKDLKKALKAFGQTIQTQGLSDLENKITLHQGKFRQLEDDRDMGLINSQDYQAGLAQLRLALLRLADEINEA